MKTVKTVKNGGLNASASVIFQLLEILRLYGLYGLRYSLFYFFNIKGNKNRYLETVAGYTFSAVKRL